MNDNNVYNSGDVKPYRATGNLNTAIGNPSVNINDTMNVNIQNVATNQMPINRDQNINLRVPTDSNPIMNNSVNVSSSGSDSTIYNISNNTSQNIDNGTASVNKTYVTTDNKPKKKNISLNLGPEFKIALLIVVILLVFIFLLPMISDMFRGY